MSPATHNLCRIALIANSGWYIYNFRRNLMRALQDAGHVVIAVSPADDYTGRLTTSGVTHRPVPLEGGSTNPLRAMRTVLALRDVLDAERIDFVLSYTPKGNIYTGLAAAGLSARQIANISGLGRSFVEKSMLTLAVKLLYRFTLARAAWVFFQNEDDRAAFVSNALVDAAQTERIPGSGVDLRHFCPEPLPCVVDLASITFLMIARMLREKGVAEFVEAARLIRAVNPNARFRLLGPLGVDNPSALSRDDMESWIREGSVEYLGVTDDVRPHIRSADCVVLPSFYREGVPRSLLEAAAMARPVITTDTAGCRDTVRSGLTGYLCRPKDPIDLAAKMGMFIDLTVQDRVDMGKRARKMVETEFDEQVVISRYLTVIAQLAKRNGAVHQEVESPFGALKGP